MGSIEIIALSVIVSTGIASAIVFIAKTWLSVQIEQTITSRYDTRFEEYRRELQTNHEATLQQLKAAQSVANAAFIQGQKVTAKHRLNAAAAFWEKMFRMRDKEPTIFGVLDLLGPNEFDLLRTRSDFRSMVDSMSFESIVSSIMEGDETELLRPFIGEACFSLYSCRRAIIGRVAILLVEDVKSGRVRHWYKDELILQTIAQILDEEEIAQFRSLPSGHLKWLRENLEEKTLEQLRRVISGQVSADEGAEQARKIQATAAKMAPNIWERRLHND